VTEVRIAMLSTKCAFTLYNRPSRVCAGAV
jgi:hypothetical protein